MRGWVATMMLLACGMPALAQSSGNGPPLLLDIPPAPATPSSPNPHGSIGSEGSSYTAFPDVNKGAAPAVAHDLPLIPPPNDLPVLPANNDPQPRSQMATPPAPQIPLPLPQIPAVPAGPPQVSVVANTMPANPALPALPPVPGVPSAPPMAQPQYGNTGPGQPMYQLPPGNQGQPAYQPLPGQGQPTYQMQPAAYATEAGPMYAPPPPNYVPSGSENFQPMPGNPATLPQPQNYVPPPQQGGNLVPMGIDMVPNQPGYQNSGTYPAPTVIYSPHAQGPPMNYTPDGAVVSPPFTGSYQTIPAEASGQTSVAPRTGMPQSISGLELWGSVDYLLWFAKGMTTPPLVQTVPMGITGTLNPADATSLPNRHFEYDPLSGVRATLGVWLTDDHRLGLVGSWSTFGTYSDGFQVFSGPGTLIGRPFKDSPSGQTSLFQLSDTSGTSGVMTVGSQFHTEGGDLDMMLTNFVSGGHSLTTLFGVRYFEINDTLNIQAHSANPSASFDYQATDYFATRNQFWGGQAGLRYEYEGDRFLVVTEVKVAYGAVNEEIKINGSTTLSANGSTSTRPGGMLALPTNIGDYTHTGTAFLPEGSLKFGYRITPNIAAFLGYNMQYISAVVRPGGVIDTTINPSNMPFVNSTGTTTVHPAVLMNTESFWLQGVTVGITVQY